MEEYSTKAVRDFLKPKTSLDKAYQIFLVLWVGVSIFISQEPILRVISFIGVIIFMVLVNFENWRATSELTLASSSIKLFIMYLIIGFFKPMKNLIEPFPELTISYYSLESIILLFVFIVAILWSYLDFKLIKRYGVPGYVAFLSKAIRGLWISALILFVFIGINLLSEQIGDIVLPWEMFLLASLIIQLFVSILPYSYDQLTGGVVKRSPLASLRDAALFSSLTLGILKIGLEFISGKAVLTYEFWNTIIPLLFLFGFVILIFEHDEQRQNLSDTFTEKAINKASDLSKKINNFGFKSPQNVFVANDVVDVLNKHKTKISTKENSLVIPVSESNDSVAIKIIGDTKCAIEDKLGNIRDEISDETMLVLSKKDWNKLTRKLQPENIDALDLNKISQKFTSKEALLEDAQQSLENYKRWTQERGLAPVKNKLASWKESSSKYGIQSYGANTRVNLPGIRVIDEGDMDIVQVGPINVLDTPKGTNVRIGNFLRVLEVGKYTMVQMPFISVLDTPKGEIVKVAGFEIVEGDKQEILGSLEHLKQLQANLDSYMNKRLSNMFLDEPPQFVLTDASKENPRLLMASSDDSIVLDEEFEGKRDTEEIATETRKHRSSSKKRHKKRATKHERQHKKERLAEASKETEIVELDEAAIEIEEIEFCSLCKKEISGRTILCPHCGEEFHYACFKDKVSEIGKCPQCGKAIAIKK